jgi:tetratricopeptide (TPR) repeat protein
MKKTKRRLETKPVAQAIPAAKSRRWWSEWWIWATALAGLLVVYQVYAPAINGAFVFDDLSLPFRTPEIKQDVTSFVGRLRPLLMLSFWIDYHRTAGVDGADPHTFHSTNILLHFLTSVIAALIALKLLEWTGVGKRMRTALAIFAGALFLLHPLQTESVAYVASRSEVLSVLFYYAAFAVFVWRPGESMTLLRALAILLLFGAAAGIKEHTLTLPVLLILTDYFWNRGGIRKNWILYGLLGVGAIFGGLYVWSIIRGANTAGFSMRDLTPVQYLLTQGRVIWIYVRMFFLPFGQNIDPDIPISQGPFDHGAIFGLAALAAVAAGAWFYRKRWPLASFGVFMFLLLIAPTSSFIPIKDVLAEHRMYLPFLGLVLICCEALRRVKFTEMVGIGATVLILCSVLTYKRNQVWSSPLALWQDSVNKSPDKYRPRFQLARQLFDENRCVDAVKSYEAASRLGPMQDQLLIDWALALDCAGRPVDEVVNKFRQAASIYDTAHVHTQIAAEYARHKRYPEALEELDIAEKMDPSYDVTFFYRGGVSEALGNRPEAQRFYRHALELNPQDQPARDALKRVSQ